MQAAMLYRHQDLRESALGCATGAEAPAEQSGNADTQRFVRRAVADGRSGPRDRVAARQACPTATVVRD
jgi:hypothetical protein